MARLNAGDSDEVKIEKLRLAASQTKILQVHMTLRLFGCLGSGLALAGIIAMTIVQVLDKPAWL